MEDSKLVGKVYVLISHPIGDMAYTLFEIPIPHNYPNHKHVPVECKGNSSEEGNWNKMQPILEFPSCDHPRFAMACAQVGATFYFLGGESGFSCPLDDYFYCEDDDDEEVEINDLEETTKVFFPSDVYVFDSTRESSGLRKLETGMNTGKPNAQVFVVEGKVYVFASSGPVTRLYMGEDAEYKTQFEDIKFFEVYDPALGKWQVLEDPPVDNPISWDVSCLLVPRQFKVYVRLYHSIKRQVLNFVFDLDTYSWAPQPTTSDNKFGWRGHPGVVIGGDCFYRLGTQGLVAQTFEAGPEKQLLLGPTDAGGDSSRGFCFLGGTDDGSERHFCFVFSDHLPNPDLPSHYQIPDHRSRFLHLFVERLVLGDQRQQHAVNNNQDKDLYSTYFLVQTTYPNLGEIIACYFVCSGDDNTGRVVGGGIENLTLAQNEDESSVGSDGVEDEAQKEITTRKDKDLVANISAPKQHDLRRLVGLLDRCSLSSGITTSGSDLTDCSIEVCLKLLGAIPKVKTGSELYMLGTRLFIKPQYREMFVALPKDVRLSWLEQELQREKRGFIIEE